MIYIYSPSSLCHIVEFFTVVSAACVFMFLIKTFVES